MRWNPQIMRMALPIDVDNLDDEVVDERAAELLAEFDKHRAVVMTDPKNQEESREAIFMGWALQELAYLHLAVEILNNQRFAPLKRKTKSD